MCRRSLGHEHVAVPQVAIQRQEGRNSCSLMLLPTSVAEAFQRGAMVVSCWLSERAVAARVSDLDVERRAEHGLADVRVGPFDDEVPDPIRAPASSGRGISMSLVPLTMPMLSALMDRSAS